MGELENAAFPYELAIKVVGDDVLGAGIFNTLLDKSRDLTYTAECACELLQMTNTLMTSIGGMDATDGAVAVLAQRLHGYMVDITGRAARGLTAGIGVFTCSANGVAVTAVRVG